MADKNKKYKSVDIKVNFTEMEKDLLDHWYKDGIVDKYLHKNDESKEYFSFMDGPITANNPMGVHHGLGRTYKDLWQRYNNMKGKRQRFQNGFDAQGLWVEVEVEKELGFKNKKDIESYGVAKFVQKCKDRVFKYSGIQTEQSKRLGYFMDWENSYYTMSDENNYMIWHFLKVCDQNGWLYKGKESVPWCPRCQTAISQHEILTEDYREVTHKSIYFELPIKNRHREFLLVWTTTPWTLPANIAVAVDSKLIYALVEGVSGDKFWMAEGAVKRIFKKDYKIVKKVKGEKLVDLTYDAPFDHLPAVQKVAQKNPGNFHKVVATDDRIMPISTEEGTGLVHTAVSAGTEDFKLGKKLGLPMIPVIDDDASYFDGFGEFSGKNAKKHPELILDYLVSEDKKKGVDWVFEINNYKHRYPVCWRCKKELVWKVTDEWYIAMDKPSVLDKDDKRTLRERMIDVAGQITWIPEFGLKRELDWLNNMHDWLISKKNRYWGLCLPVWECDKCRHFEVVGSKKELKQKAAKGWDQFEGKSPHKPYIDKIVLKCPKCESEMHRIEPVGNPWLDAGIVSFSTIAKSNKGEPLYLKDKEKWENWFPADFITESFPGQFKNWFYAMIAMSTVLEDRAPYKTVLGFATLLDEKGRGMHKSLGNAIEFNEGADKIGVDVMRWMYLRQNTADNLLFGYNYGDEIRRQFYLKIYNVYNFFVTYANLDGWYKETSGAKLGKLSHVLDRWIASRFFGTLKSVEQNLDEYNAQKATESIEGFVEDLSNWYVRRSRDRGGLYVVNTKDKEKFYSTLYFMLLSLCKLLAPFTPFITEKIYTEVTNGESVHLESWPKAEKKYINEKLELDMAHAREAVEQGHALRKLENIPVRQPLNKITVKSPYPSPENQILELVKDELNVKQVEWKKGSELKVTLDTKLTPELKEEAETRKLIRDIQSKRREIGVKLTDKVEVSSPWLPVDKILIEDLKARTLTTKLTKAKSFKVVKSS